MGSPASARRFSTACSTLSIALWLFEVTPTVLPARISDRIRCEVVICLARTGWSLDDEPGAIERLDGTDGRRQQPRRIVPVRSWDDRCARWTALEPGRVATQECGDAPEPIAVLDHVGGCSPDGRAQYVGFQQRPARDKQTPPVGVPFPLATLKHDDARRLIKAEDGAGGFTCRGKVHGFACRNFVSCSDNDIGRSGSASPCRSNPRRLRYSRLGTPHPPSAPLECAPAGRRRPPGRFRFPTVEPDKSAISCLASGSAPSGWPQE